MNPKRKKKQKKRKDNNFKLIIISFTAFLLLISLSYYFYKNRESNTFSRSTEYQVKGIDVSHHNPILNWREVRNQNISFAYIKATEGITHEDRNYPYNYKLARESNIKVGSYHFYIFGISGRDQAKHFIKTAQVNSGDLLPAIDIEHSPDNPYSTDSIFVNQVLKELKILENEFFEHYGLHPIIYTNLDCYKLYINNNFPDNPIWICSLDKEPSDNIKNWVIWQFSHKGELSGMVGDIDFNYFRYSFDRLNSISFP